MSRSSSRLKSWQVLVSFGACLLVLGTGTLALGGWGQQQVITRQPQTEELLMVQAVFRHGARTPLSTMYWPDTQYADCINHFQGAELQLVDESGAGQDMSPIDLDEPQLPGGCRMGQLTPDGYQLARGLGQWLHTRYMHHLPIVSTTFKASQVYLRSTRIQRAIQTLQGVVTGLWPDLSDTAANDPVTVHASAEELEYEYGNNRTCPALTPITNELLQKVKALDQSDTRVQQLAAQVASALQLAGGAAAVSWVRLHDTLAAMAAHTGTQMPDGYTPHILQQVDHQAARDESRVLAPLPHDMLLPPEVCPHVVRLSIGPLLWHLQQHMLQHAAAAAAAAAAQASAPAVGSVPRPIRAGMAQAQAAESSHLPRLYLYSGHDSTITPMLAALGRPETAWPPFTASIVLELWRTGQQGQVSTGQQPGTAAPASDASLWVRVLYNRKPLNMELAYGDTAQDEHHARRLKDGWLRLEELQLRLGQFSLSPDEHQQQCRHQQQLLQP